MNAQARPSLALLLALAAALPACSKEVPLRPVPQAEFTQQQPPWFPEKPWNVKSGPAKQYLEGKVVFRTAKHNLRAPSKVVLEQLANYLKANPDISRLRLEGHTDARAGEEYNIKLSQRRALEVANWLVDHGIDNERLVAVAFGEARPRATNLNAAGRQENRRTEFHIVEVDGHRFRDRDPTAGGLVIYVKSKAEREAEKKKGKVPVFKIPKVNPEKDIIKPVPPKRDKTKPVGLSGAAAPPPKPIKLDPIPPAPPPKPAPPPAPPTEPNGSLDARH